MKKSLISIIVPIYNTQQYLSQCIDSIINQTYSNIEILLLNDGSIDKSLEICKQYEKLDNRITVIDKKNSGVSDTRNVGIKLSKGKYIMFVDSDDILDRQCVEIIEKNTSSNSLTICDINKFKGENYYNNTEKRKTLNIIKVSKNNFLDVYKKELINSPVGRLYETKIIKEKKIFFDETVFLGEDLLFNLNYLYNIDFINVIDEKLYNYRLGNRNSLSQKYVKNMIDIKEKLCNEFSSFFSFENKEKVNKECIKFYISVVSNEFHNKKINFIRRYINAIKVLKSEKIKKAIDKYKNSFSKFEYFLLKHNFFITYKLLKK